MLLKTLRLVVKPQFVVIKQEDSLQLYDDVCEESYLVTSFEGLDTHTDCKAISSLVLDVYIAVLKTSLIQNDFLRQQKAIDLDLEADLIALFARAYECM